MGWPAFLKWICGQDAEHEKKGGTASKFFFRTELDGQKIHFCRRIGSFSASFSEKMSSTNDEIRQLQALLKIEKEADLQLFKSAIQSQPLPKGSMTASRGIP